MVRQESNEEYIKFLQGKILPEGGAGEQSDELLQFLRGAQLANDEKGQEKAKEYAKVRDRLEGGKYRALFIPLAHTLHRRWTI